jgi:hypothetical protein
LLLLVFHPLYARTVFLLLLANARIVLVWFILSRLLLTLAFSLTEGTEDGKQLAKAFLEYSKQNGGEYGI